LLFSENLPQQSRIILVNKTSKCSLLICFFTSGSK
jgi:NAD-dependent SIR2 family protein deacetylase